MPISELLKNGDISLEQLLKDGDISLEELAAAINVYGRDMASVPLVSVVHCDFCSDSFLSHPQDAKRIRNLKLRSCCWKKECRSLLREEQVKNKNKRMKSKRKV